MMMWRRVDEDHSDRLASFATGVAAQRARLDHLVQVVNRLALDPPHSLPTEDLQLAHDTALDMAHRIQRYLQGQYFPLPVSITGTIIWVD